MKDLLRARQGGTLKLLLSAFFLTAIIYPFLRMVLHIRAEDVSRVLRSPSFFPALTTSLKAAAVSTALSVALGLLLAACLQRTRLRRKETWAFLLALPMLLPSVSHGMGLIVLFGTNGVLRNLLGLRGTVYGFWGMVAGAVLYSYPVVFLMLNDVLKYEDGSPYEAAAVLGLTRFQQIRAVTLPYLKRPLVSAVFAAFTLSVTDYGIPLMIGGKEKTLAVLMYQEVLGQVDFGKGSVIGLLLLLPALFTFVFNAVFRPTGRTACVTRPVAIGRNRGRDILAFCVCGAVVLGFGVLLGAFGVVGLTARYPSDLTWTLANVEKTLRLRGGEYLCNSLVISLFVAALGVCIAFLTAYLTTRMPTGLSRCLHLFAITSLAVPGIVLGLSYAMAFSGSFFYGTMAILVLVNLMHFFASPYLLFYNSLNKLNEHIENVGATLGICRVRIVAQVIVPQCRSTIFEAFSYFFVNSMITISAVSFLAAVSTKPLSLMINQFEAQMQYECAAVVSLMLFFVNAAVKWGVSAVSQTIKNTSEKNI